MYFIIYQYLTIYRKCIVWFNRQKIKLTKNIKFYKHNYTQTINNNKNKNFSQKKGHHNKKK